MWFNVDMSQHRDPAEERNDLLTHLLTSQLEDEADCDRWGGKYSSVWGSTSVPVHDSESLARLWSAHRR